MRCTLIFLLFSISFSCSKPKKTQKKTIVKKEKKPQLPKLPKPVKSVAGTKLKPVSKKLLENLEILISELGEYEETINISTVFKKHFKGFDSKNIDFPLPAKANLRVMEISKDRLYGAMLWIEPVVGKTKGKLKKSENEEEPNDDKEIESFGLFVSIKFINNKAKIVLQKCESSGMGDENAVIMFPPFFKYTGAFVVSYKTKAPSEKENDLDDKTSDIGATTDVFELSNNGIKRFSSFIESIEESVPGFNIEDETNTSWIKSSLNKSVYFVMTTITIKEYYNTGEDLDDPHSFVCSRTIKVVAMPMNGLKWKYLKKKGIDQLRKTDPAFKKIPKDLKEESKGSCKTIKI
jgi:hypothetical protein